MLPTHNLAKVRFLKKFVDLAALKSQDFSLPFARPFKVGQRFIDILSIYSTFIL